MSNNTPARRGRPANPNATRTIRLEAETHKICGPGRPNPTKKYLELTILKTNFKNFIYGKTPVVSENVINNTAPATHSKISVTVTNSEPPSVLKDF